MRPDVNLRSIVNRTSRSKTSTAECIIGTRPVWFGESYVPTPVYDRELLPVGATFEGPAILNQMDATTVVEPGDRVSIDELGNLMIEVNR